MPSVCEQPPPTTTGVFKDNRCDDLQERNCSFPQGIRYRSRSRTQSIVLEPTQLLEAAVKKNAEKGMNSEHCKGEELTLGAVVSALTAAPFRGARGPGEVRQCLRNRSGLGAKLRCAENAVTLKLLASSNKRKSTHETWSLLEGLEGKNPVFCYLNILEPL